MNSKRFFLVGLVFLAAALAVKGFLIDAGRAFEPVRFSHTALTTIGAWFQTVHAGHNAWLPWRADPFLMKLALLCPDPHGALFGLMLFFHALGLAALSFFSRPAIGLRAAGIIGILGTALVLHLFMFDIVLWGALTWWPWLAIAATAAARAPANQTGPLFAAVFFFGFRLGKAGNALAPFSTGIALLTAVLLLTAAERDRQKRLWLIAIVAALPLVFMERAPEITPFPDYPTSARIVPDDGVPGFSRALAGPDRPLPVIDREFLDRAYSAFTLVMLGISLWAWLVTRRDRRESSDIAAPLTVATLCAAAAAWDTLSGGMGEASPLRALERMVPLLGFSPLLPLATALTIELLVAMAVLSRRLTPLVLVSAAVLTVSFENGAATWSWRSLPGSVQRNSMDEILAAAALVNPPTAGQKSSSEAQTLLLSPSAGLISREGLWTVASWSLADRIRWQPLGARIDAITVSGGSASPTLMIDGDAATRWSEGLGRQTGHEMVQISFKEPITLGGIELDPGSFKTDFPTGLRISAKDLSLIHI